MRRRVHLLMLILLLLPYIIGIEPGVELMAEQIKSIEIEENTNEVEQMSAKQLEKAAREASTCSTITAWSSDNVLAFDDEAQITGELNVSPDPTADGLEAGDRWTTITIQLSDNLVANDPLSLNSSTILTPNSLDQAYNPETNTLTFDIADYYDLSLAVVEQLSFYVEFTNANDGDMGTINFTATSQNGSSCSSEINMTYSDPSTYTVEKTRTSPDSDYVTLGDEITYEVKTIAGGTGAITGTIEMVDNLPTGVSVVDSDGGTVDGNTVTWSLTEEDFTNRVATKTVTIKINQDEDGVYTYETGQTITNEVDLKVDGAIVDQAEVSDEISESLIILPNDIQKTAHPGETGSSAGVRPGDKINWTFDNIGVEGVGTLNNYRVVDVMPADVFLVDKIYFGTYVEPNSLKKVTVSYTKDSRKSDLVITDIIEGGEYDLTDEEGTDVETITYYFGDIQLPFNVENNDTPSVDTILTEDILEQIDPDTGKPYSTIKNQVHFEFDVDIAQGGNGDFDEDSYTCPPPYDKIDTDPTDGIVQCGSDGGDEISITDNPVVGGIEKTYKNEAPYYKGDTIEYTTTIHNNSISEESIQVEMLTDDMNDGEVLVEDSLKVTYQGVEITDYVLTNESYPGEFNIIFNNIVNVEPGEDLVFTYETELTDDISSKHINKAYVNIANEITSNGSGTIKNDSNDLNGNGNTTDYILYDQTASIPVNPISTTIDKEVVGTNRDFLPETVVDNDGNPIAGKYTVPYEITITNDNQSGIIYNPTLIDDLPKVLTIMEDTITVETELEYKEPVITGTVDDKDETQQMQIDFTGALKPGESITVHFDAHVDDYAQYGKFTNTAELVLTDQNAVVDTKNSILKDSVAASITGIAGQKLTKVASKYYIAAGQAIRYDIKLFNTGTYNLSNIKLSDDIPRSDDGRFDPDTGTLSAGLADSYLIALPIITMDGKALNNVEYTVGYRDDNGELVSEVVDSARVQEIQYLYGFDAIEELDIDLKNTVLNPGSMIDIIYEVETDENAENNFELYNNVSVVSGVLNETNSQIREINSTSNTVETVIQDASADSYTIGDFVYFDYNDNEVFDSKDEAAQGIRIELYKDNDFDGTYDPNNSELVAYSLTNSEGKYSFPALEAGDYYVHESASILDQYYLVHPENGYTFSTSDENYFPSEDSGSKGPRYNNEMDFNLHAGVISGNVYYDENYNGVNESSEGVITNATPGVSDEKLIVELQREETGTYTTYETITTSNGYYEFTNLPAGNYRVITKYAADEDLDSDGYGKYIYTTETQIDQSLEIGELSQNNDFGLVEPAEINGTIWDDFDMEKDFDESGIENIEVKLTNNNDSSLNQTITTDENGYYEFNYLLPGSYDVSYQAPAETGYVNEGESSFTNGVLGATSLGPKDSLTKNGGLFKYSRISGKIYEDMDLNYKFEGATDQYIANRQVELLDQKQNVIATTTTNDVGTYVFTNVLPREDYTVRFTTNDNEEIVDSSLTSDTTVAMDGTLLINNELVIPGETISSNNASIVIPFVIAGTVFEDMNGDDLYNDSSFTNDQVIADVTVNLLDENANVIDTALTDENGNYSFDKLYPGTYQVQVINPEGFYSSTMNYGNDQIDSDIAEDTDLSSVYKLMSHAPLTDIDAGYYQYANLEGYVYEDIDVDYTYSTGDRLIENSNVKLYLNGTEIAQTTTDADGHYSFTNLKPGNYKTNITEPSAELFPSSRGESNTAYANDIDHKGYTYTTLVQSNETNSVDFDGAFIKPATISGTTFYEHTPTEDLKASYDSDKDDVVKSVSLDLINVDTGKTVQTVNSDAKGQYTFGNLEPGNYIVKSYGLNGLEQLTVDSGIDSTGYSTTLSPSYGENITGIDNGLFADQLFIGDKVFEDQDMDGIQDEGEPGISGVKITLHDDEDNVLGEATTDNNGIYQIVIEHPGTYHLEAEIPSGYLVTPAYVGSDDSIDSDFTYNEVLDIYESEEVFVDTYMNNTIDLGLQDLSTISGYVYRDLDQSGTKSSGDDVFSNREVILKDSDDNEVAKTQTNADGYYEFKDLTPGQYYVEFGEPLVGNWTVEDDARLLINETNNTAKRIINVAYNTDNTNENAGYENNSTISGYAYEDMNANGKYNQLSGDQYLANVSASLYEEGVSTPIATTTTNESGYYSITFEHNNTRNYYVEFDLSSMGMNASDLGVVNTSKDNDTKANGQTIVSPISDGGLNDVSFDAGLYTGVDLGGIVYEDKDFESTYSTGDNLLSGIDVKLYDQDNNLVGTTVSTNASGEYEFTNLKPGTYHTEFVIPSAYHVSPKANPAIAGDNDADSFGITAENTYVSGNSDHVNYDAALYKPGTISGTIFYETKPVNNAIASYDSEVDIAQENVQVELLDQDKNVIATTLTDADGNYQFSDLDPGKYYTRSATIADTHYLNVEEGIKDTGVSTQITLAYDQEMQNVDGGVFADHLYIGDTVFNDLNANGVQDSGENGIEGITVSLYSNNTNLVDTTTTDANGNYQFEVDKVDLYSIKVDIPFGYHASEMDQTTDDKDSDINSSGVSDSIELYADTNNLDAGLVELGSISGNVYRDIDHSGDLNQGDTNYGGQEVTLTNKDTGVKTKVNTDSSGNFKFDELDAGDYEIAYNSSPAGTWYASSDAKLEINQTDNTAIRNVTLGINQDLTNQNAGYIVNTAISGRVYEDLLADGYYDNLQDVNLSGIEVELYQNDIASPIMTTTTDANGKFIFNIENVGTNDYYTKVALPTGYDGYADALLNHVSSDNDTSANGTTNPVSVAEGSVNDVDFDTAMYQGVDLSGYIYEDMDYNSNYNTGDIKLENIKVNLMSDSEYVASVNTDANGYFEFTDLKPATYYTQVEKPNEYQVSKLAAADTALANDLDENAKSQSHHYVSNESDTVNYDGALYQAVSISGYIYEDMNINGQKDSEDQGISNYTVNLIQNGTNVQSTTTTSSGYYEFTNLVPANYETSINPGSYQISQLGTANKATDNDLNQSGSTNSQFVKSGENNTVDYDGALYTNATIGGIIYDDMNADGTKDAEDTVIANQKVALMQEDVEIATTTTNTDGTYEFENITPGTYHVNLVDNTRQISPNLANATAGDNDMNASGETNDITISSGQTNNVDFDAALYNFASLEGIVYDDMDANTHYNSAVDQVLANINVELYNGSTKINSTTTDANGKYVFTNLVPAEYSVKVSIGDYQISSLGAENTAGDNDLNQTALTNAHNLISGQTNSSDYDAALYNYAKLSGYVYEDYEADSTYNDGYDRMLENETVYLFKDGIYLTSTTSDANGYYEFNDLKPGYYQVYYEQNDWLISELGNADTKYDNDMKNDGYSAKKFLSSSEENSVSFDIGLYEQSRLSGYVYEDKNLNGKKDPSETGIKGVTVNLYDSNGLVHSTTTTNNSGFYVFFKLDPEDYYVEVEIPDNYYVTNLGTPATAGDSDLKPDGTTDSHFIESEGTNTVDYDAGLYTTTSLSGYVYNDLNANGQKDGKDMILPNMSMSLLKDGTQIATTTTDRTGYYEFVDIMPGNYEVAIELNGRNVSIKGNANTTFDNDFNPNGISDSQFVLSSTPNNVDYDAALYTYATIGGVVYEDMDADGNKQLFDTGLENFKVELYNDEDELVASTYSDPRGRYEFTELIPDEYYVLVDNQGMEVSDLSTENTADANDLQDNHRTKTHEIVSGYENNVDYDAALYDFTQMSGYLYEDRDNNGTMTDVDKAIEKHKIYLYQDGEIIDSAVTDETGYYEFTELDPGTYNIKVASFNERNTKSLYNVAVKGIVHTILDNDLNEDLTTDQVKLVSGEVEDKSNDGAVFVGINISGNIYEDMNINGQKDSNDLGIEDIYVELYNQDGFVALTQSDANGSYSFSNLDPGTYHIKVLTKKYLVSQLGNENTENDNDLTKEQVTNGRTYLSGEYDLVNYDAALYTNASLSGYIYEDLNVNSHKEDNEEPLNDIQVDLYDQTGTVIATTTTNQDGYYEFTDITPGRYYVQVVSDEYYVSSLGNAHTAYDNDLQKSGKTPYVRLSSHEENTTDFDGGLYQNATIMGAVYEDINADGNFETDDVPLANYTVQLYRQNVTDTRSSGRLVKVAETTTNESGIYTFEDVTPGYYQIYVDPEGRNVSPKSLTNDLAGNDMNKLGFTQAFFVSSGEVQFRKSDSAMYNYASLNGYVYNDLDADGEYETEDELLDDEVVELYQNDKLVNTSKSINGYYEFTDLVPGDYQVKVVNDKYTASVLGRENNAYSNDASNTDNGIYTQLITLKSGETNSVDNDVAIYEAVSIGGYIYHDYNIDGKYNKQDEMLANKTVKLFDANGNVTEATTNQDGYYEFTDLKPGTYNTVTDIGSLNVTDITKENTKYDNDANKEGSSLTHTYVSGETDFVNYDTALYSDEDRIVYNKDHGLDENGNPIVDEFNDEKVSISDLHNTAKEYALMAIVMTMITLVSMLIIRRKLK